MIGKDARRPSVSVRLERKTHPSDLEAALFRTRAERAEATRLCLRLWKKYFKGLNKNLYARFRKLEEGAGEDLMALASEGANPNIIISILYISVWYQGLMDSVVQAAGGLPCSQEIRKLSSTDYWDSGTAALRRAYKFISSLMSYTLPQAAVQGLLSGGKGDSFVRVCKNAAGTEERVGELLKTIEELGLCKEGWMWRRVSGKLEPLQTGRRGISKSGRDRAGARKLHWGFCAAELHYYLKRKTGKSHLGTIARLLHYAGFDKEFPIGIPRDGQRLTKDMSNLSDERWKYRNRIRKRVVALLLTSAIYSLHSHAGFIIFPA